MKTLKTIAAVLVLGAAAPALADHPFNPDCHLEGINQALDSVMAQIQSSPAFGHAGGHYGRALEDLKKVKNQLHDGCRAWNGSLGRNDWAR